MSDYKKSYIEFLKKNINVPRLLTVVFDMSNGPGGIIVPELFQNTNIKAVILNDAIDPDFKAHGPNPMLDGASNQCKQAILDHKADMGVMFDADADRAFFLDDTGTLMPACFVCGLMFGEFKPPYILDELVYQSVKILGMVPEAQIVPSRIGAYFIKETLRAKEAEFGAEYSGHYYFKEFFNADSGIFAAIAVINTVSKIDTNLSDWRERFGEHTVTTKEIKIEEGKEMRVVYDELEQVFSIKAKNVDKRDGVTFIFDTYWINIRASNTEPILRIVAGGDGAKDVVVKEIESLIKFEI